jgi:hypothetical protein
VVYPFIVPDKPDDKAELVSPVGDPHAVTERPGEPPVVARLVIEIRSDGSRTIARGAMEDLTVGQRVSVEAQGATPLSLALSLARAIFKTPFLAGAATRAVLGRKKKK